MLNILRSLTDYLLQHEEKTEESCDIPDENIQDWLQQVDDEIAALSSQPEKHRLRLEQLRDIHDHLQQVLAIRATKCASHPDPKGD